MTPWIAVALALALATGAQAAPTCAPADPALVAQTARDAFTAAKADDAAGFRALIADDFYAYDGGKRFDGMALFDLIKAAHAAGKTYDWSVDQPDVKQGCDWAFIAYVNHGSITDAKGKTALTWLESDLMRWQGGRWRIAFLHSTRAAP